MADFPSEYQLKYSSNDFFLISEDTQGVMTNIVAQTKSPTKLFLQHFNYVLYYRDKNARLYF